MVLMTPILLAVIIAVGSAWLSRRRTLRMLDQTSRLLRDPVLDAEMDRLATALDLPAIRVHVLDTEQVNGLAAPDGRIFLTNGFVRCYREGQVTAAEIAGVVAHELGHVALGHSQRRVIDVAGSNAINMVLTLVLSRFVPGFGPILARLLASALGAGLSRRDEHEADAYASALLVKAGIGTAPQKSLFRKLEKLTGGAGAGTPAWLRSHPKTESRIAQIEQREARWT